MKLSKGFFEACERHKLSHTERYFLIDAIRRWCLAQHAEEIGEGGSRVPIRLRWGRGANSAGLSRDGFRQVRNRLCKADLIGRCRDGDKVRPDGRAKLMRDWFVIKIG